MTNFQNKFRIGALAYLDYGFYYAYRLWTAVPREPEPAGPGQQFFNSFDINRVYLNTYFTPTDDLTFRFTPEIYRANGTAHRRQDRRQHRLRQQSRRRSECAHEVRLCAVQGLLDESRASRAATLPSARSRIRCIPLGGRSLPVPLRLPVPWNYLGLSRARSACSSTVRSSSMAAKRPICDYGVGVYDNGNFNQPGTDRYQAGDGTADRLSVRLVVASTRDSA